MAGPWDKYKSAGPINSGVNPATVTARQNANRGDAQFQYQIQRDRDEDSRTREKEDRERAQITNAIASTSQSLQRTIKILQGIRADALDGVPGFMGEKGWGETGTSGNIMRSIPFVSNAAKDLERKIQTVKGINAFSALQNLAQQGVKLTPISNAEIELAASSVANIDPSLSQREFLAAIDQALEFHNSTLKQLGKANSSATAKPTRNAPPSDIQAIMRKYGAQ